MRNSTLKSDFITVFCATLVVIFFYYDVFNHLNSTIFGLVGDGIKNYYTLWYHSLYGTSFWHVEGLNYPFGEHLVFTDAQPVIAYLIYILRFVFPQIGNYIPGILNSLMFISIIFGVLYTEKILRHFSLKQFISIPTSILIVMMSPQMERLTAHYALSYVVILPLLIYNLILFSKQYRFRESIWIGLILCFFSLIHFYYLLIAGMFIGLFLVAEWIQQRKSILLVHGFIQVLFPTLIVYSIIYFTDTVPDRPENPIGYFLYTSELSTVFFSMHSPIIQYIIVKILNLQVMGIEGRNYLGVLFAINFPLAVYFVAIKKVSIPKSLLVILLISIAMLVFSFGYPMKIMPDKWIENFGILRQFRSLGRFAWVFYFSATIFAIVVIYIWFINNKVNRLIKILLICISVFYLNEFYNFNSNLNEQINNQITKGKFNLDFEPQAILPIPFFHDDSEVVKKEPDKMLFLKTLLLSLDTGLPIVSNSLSRTSFKQTHDVLNALFGNQNKINELFNEKPFLIIVGADSILNNRDKEILKDATKIGDYRGLEVFILNKIPQAHQDSLKNVIYSNRNITYLQDSIRTNASRLKFVVEVPIMISAPSYIEYQLKINHNGRFEDYKLTEDLIYTTDSSFVFSKTVSISDTNFSFVIQPRFGDIALSRLWVLEDSLILIKNEQ